MKIKNIFKIREINLLAINIIIIFVMSILFPNFRSINNIFGMLYAISINSMIAGAMTVLFVSGGFDLSVGATLGFSGIMAGLMMVKFSIPIIPSILIALLIGAALGATMGGLIAYIGINPFIVTLAGWFIIESFKYIVTGASNVSGFPSAFASMASFEILNVPMIIIVAIVLIIIFAILLQKNIYFRKSYFIGGNEQAALLAGIKVRKIKFFNYVIVSTFAALAGIFSASRFMAAYVGAGAENSFHIITAVILGGASLKGGRGSVAGTFLGLVLMALVYDSFIFLKLDILWNKIAIGAILIIAVLIDVNIQKRRELTC